MTHRQVWAMAGPIVLANISIPLLGAVDTAVVGHIGEVHYIGAVAIGAMLFNFIYHLFNCLRMGTTGPTAQARGAGDHAEVRMMLARALLLAAAAGGALVALQLPILALAFWLIPRYGILAAGALLSFYYIASVGIMALRGIREIKMKEER